MSLADEIKLLHDAMLLGCLPLEPGKRLGFGGFLLRQADAFSVCFVVTHFPREEPIDKEQIVKVTVKPTIECSAAAAMSIGIRSMH